MLTRSDESQKALEKYLFDPLNCMVRQGMIRILILSLPSEMIGATRTEKCADGGKDNNNNNMEGGTFKHVTFLQRVMEDRLGSASH